MKRSTSCRGSMLLAAFVVAVATLADSGCKQAKEAAVAPPPVVTVARPLSESVANYLDFTGNTTASQTVSAVARV